MLLARWLRRWQLWWALSLSRPFYRNIGGRVLSPHELGAFGEDLATVWLRRHGRRVLRRNYRADQGGEVDIVYRHGATLVFAEVKSRARIGEYRPADAVDETKRQLIRRGAQSWLRLLPKGPLQFRFDIIEVVLQDGMPPCINVIEHAFAMPPGQLLRRY
jgi:putative endonuclease